MLFLWIPGQLYLPELHFTISFCVFSPSSFLTPSHLLLPLICIKLSLRFIIHHLPLIILHHHFSHHRANISQQLVPPSPRNALPPSPTSASSLPPTTPHLPSPAQALPPSSKPPRRRSRAPPPSARPRPNSHSLPKPKRPTKTESTPKPSLPVEPDMSPTSSPLKSRSRSSILAMTRESLMRRTWA